MDKFIYAVIAGLITLMFVGAYLQHEENKGSVMVCHKGFQYLQNPDGALHLQTDENGNKERCTE
jgi:hypothetical protein